MRRLLVLAGLLGLACGGGGTAPVTPPPKPVAPPPPAEAQVPAATWADLRSTWTTSLLHAGPAPGPNKLSPPPAGVELVSYDSPVGPLPAWWAHPSAQGAQVPLVVFAHAGFALDARTFDGCVPLLQAGYAVMLPTWRGETGNPGSFEMYGGELDDLAAAVRFGAAQRGVDPARVYVVGEQEGGHLAALTALRPDIPIAGSASIGGLFRSEDFLFWRKMVPFDLDNPLELRMRLLYPNLAEMKRGHIAYVSEEDEVSAKAVAAFDTEARRRGARLRIEVIKANQRKTLGGALTRFTEAATAEDFPRPRDPVP